MKLTVRTANRIEHKLLADELRRLRKEKGMSQRRVQELLNRGTGWTNRIEKAERYLDFATIFDIIRLLGGNVPEIMQRVDEAAEAHYKKIKEPRPFPPVEG